jgi:hypothetical protein
MSLAASAQGPRMDGRWEVKMVMSMPGMPKEIPPVTTTTCVTPEEAKDPQKTIANAQRGQRSNCKVNNYKTTGNKVTWSMACEGAEPMTGEGEYLYAGDSYTGTVKMTRAGQVMTMKYSGKRLGDCTK